MYDGGGIQSHHQVPRWMHKHNMEWNKRCFLQILLTTMLHKMCEKYGNDSKCEIQVKEICLELIHKPPKFYVQEEARLTTGMIQLPCKWTCILISHFHNSNLHTHKQRRVKFSKCWCKSWKHQVWTQMQVQVKIKNSLKFPYTSLILSARSKQILTTNMTNLWAHLQTHLHTYSVLYTPPFAHFHTHLHIFTPTHINAQTLLTCICDLVIFSLNHDLVNFLLQCKSRNLAKAGWLKSRRKNETKCIWSSNSCV